MSEVEELKAKLDKIVATSQTHNLTGKEMLAMLILPKVCAYGNAGTNERVLAQAVTQINRLYGDDQ